jgi:hypothetical protein
MDVFFSSRLVVLVYIKKGRWHRNRRHGHEGKNNVPDFWVSMPGIPTRGPAGILGKLGHFK